LLAHQAQIETDDFLKACPGWKRQTRPRPRGSPFAGSRIGA
jgi:hypothetical protein